MTDRELTPDFPLAGLRRNARALAVGVGVLLAIFLLVPDIAPRPSRAGRQHRHRGRRTDHAAIAVGLIARRIPFIGEGTGIRHAPGWD